MFSYMHISLSGWILLLYYLFVRFMCDIVTSWRIELRQNRPLTKDIEEVMIVKREKCEDGRRKDARTAYNSSPIFVTEVDLNFLIKISSKFPKISYLSIILVQKFSYFCHTTYKTRKKTNSEQNNSLSSFIHHVPLQTSIDIIS